MLEAFIEKVDKDFKDSGIGNYMQLAQKRN